MTGNELNLDELAKVSGGTDFSVGAENNGATIPFQCSCGTIIYVRLGDTFVKCPNPRCRKETILNN